MDVNAGNTAWVLMSTALVMLMTPALGFFYGGLVRQKNVLATLMHSFGVLALISVVWVLWGYSLAFGPDAGGGLVGDLSFFGLTDVGPEPSEFYGTTIPHLLFMMFQGMFAIITVALITGAFAERFRLKALVVFAVAWSTLVYSPIAHWVWSVDGWLFDLGSLDFAGGTVVHISSGVAALVAALVVGRRVGFKTEKMDPHNLTYTVLGAGLLWFGWFGFNAGSALAADGLAANALVVTNTAAAMGAMTWLTATWIRDGRPSVLGAAAGAVAGLVAITPAAGFVDTPSAVVIGFGAGILCYAAVGFLKEQLGVDDALDVFAVHGVGGIWGALATGLFADASINSAGDDGLFFGNAAQLWEQAVAVGVVAIFSAVVTFGILKAIEYTIGLRVPEDEEVAGLDGTTHGEFGYQL